MRDWGQAQAIFIAQDACFKSRVVCNVHGQEINFCEAGTPRIIIDSTLPRGLMRRFNCS